MKSLIQLAIAAVALPLALSSATTSALAADTCSRGQAQKDVVTLHQNAAEKLRKESAPLKLEKDKVGRVLVARPAPEELDEDELREDLKKLVSVLEKSPGSACDEALRVRKKYAL